MSLRTGERAAGQDAAAPEPASQATRGPPASGHPRSWFIRWLPSSRASRWFVASAFIDSAGTGLFLAGSALFFTLVLGLSTMQVGLGLSVSGGVGFLCQVPLGRLADRFGGRRALVALQAWRGCCFLAYPFIHSFALFVLVACLAGVPEWAAAPIAQAVIGVAAQGESRVRTMATITAVRNVGFTLGALSATVAISVGSATGFRALVLADAVSFFIGAAMFARLRLPPQAEGAAGKPARRRGSRIRDVRYLTLSACNGVLYLHTILLTVGLPLWVATQTRAPKLVVGGLVSLNTVLAVVLQVRLSRGGDDVGRAARKQRLAGWSLAACCVAVSVTGRLDAAAAATVILAAAAVLTVGEIWQSTGAWGLSYGLSPESDRSYHLSVYGLGATGAVVVGPILMTSAVLRAGAAGWLGLAAVFALTGTVVPLIARRPGRHARSRSRQRARG